MTEAPPGASGFVTDVDIVALRPGARIGRHEVLAVLGQGGFGITYLARDSQLNREVAIKEYLPTSLAYRADGITVLPRSTRVADDFTWGRDRFVAEGQTLASLHRAPGIVHVFDFLEINGTAYIVMEMLHGDTLADRIKRDGPLDPAAVERILWVLLDGLEQVHDAGFLHRDIKPANILLDAAGNPTLIDFGASRAAIAGRTTAMTAIFTPGYAAGEQMTSAKQGPWTDIYGLSATLYHALVGKPPPNAFDRMLDDTYEPLVRMTIPGLPPAVAAGLDAGLAVRASDRPQSIAGCRAVLSMGSPASADATQFMSRTVDREAMHVPRTSPSAPSDRTPAPAPRAKPRTTLYAGIAAAVVLLTGGGWFALSPALLPTTPPPAKAPPTATTALQEMKVEDLERALADRRAADAAAAEKQRLVEEALRKAEADAAAKLAADADLAKAETARRQAEDELARLKAEIAVRRQEETQAQALARRAEAEAAQRRAEAEMAALRQAEDDARAKAAAEAAAKIRADEALASAQAERQAADEQASRKAATAAKEKAEASANQLAAAEAREKAEADAAAAQKKTAESAEAALRLAPADLQRLQLALTSLGFDTRGTDGAFGPRTRETIAAWQKARGQSSTGFLTAAQQQALLREAAPALQKHDEGLKEKQEEARRKDEEDRKRVEADAKAKAKAGVAAASSQPPAAASPGPAAPPVSAAPSAYDGQWVGSIVPRNGPVQHITVQIRNGAGSTTRHNMRCHGDVTLSLAIRPDGSYTALVDGMDSQCVKISGSFAGAVEANQIVFTSGQGTKFALRR